MDDKLRNALTYKWAGILAICDRLGIPTYTRSGKSSKAVAQIQKELQRSHFSREYLISIRWVRTSYFGGYWEYALLREAATGGSMSIEVPDPFLCHHNYEVTEIDLRDAGHPTHYKCVVCGDKFPVIGDTDKWEPVMVDYDKQT
jgi:hypothetical protein